MRRIALALFLIAVAPMCAAAAELLMVEQAGCMWCRRWHDEIGPGYPKSAEGQLAPLRRIDLGTVPEGVTLKLPVTVTPTFVLVDNGREVGRLTGYAGANFFYGMLAPLLDKLKLAQKAEVTRP
ncbi:MAG: thioredoxin family protein [Hyphomicrobiaceae bacterium]